MYPSLDTWPLSGGSRAMGEGGVKSFFLGQKCEKIFFHLWHHRFWKSKCQVSSVKRGGRVYIMKYIECTCTYGSQLLETRDADVLRRSLCRFLETSAKCLTFASLWPGICDGETTIVLVLTISVSTQGPA